VSAALVLTLLSGGVLLSRAAVKEDGKAAIRAVLDRQVAAWNRGGLEAFLSGYWNSPDLTFFSGATVVRGWQPTLERYRRRYQSDEHQMGKLAFSDLQIEMLGPAGAFVRGRWRLQMPDGKQPNGLFTLIFRRFANGWKIIHDHTSAGA
jgi:beta-aspartyl-peptidase (threonine type)